MAVNYPRYVPRVLAALFLTVGFSARAADQIHMAILTNGVAEVQQLLDNGADANGKDDQGRTLLSWAVRLQRKKIAELLLAKGADPNPSMKGGLTLLHEIAGVGQTDMIGLLVSNGAPIDCKNELGETPLDLAAGTGAKASVELLLEMGANVNDRAASSGRTALFWAVENLRKDVVEVLLRYKADPNIRDNTRRTPLWYVTTSPMRAPFARQPDVKAQDAERRQAEREIAEILLTHGADPNAKDLINQTPLHAAVVSGMTDIAELLIAHGADVNVRDVAGGTPLRLAETAGNKAIADLLRKHAATD
ncbi:MAG TPA: ankyrin repeat domain-containing protein [Verrucomicrobiae bacterium]|nr:ankyrin repeat domain-containing protein [Verrucomicrobiae bacterium]